MKSQTQSGKKQKRRLDARAIAGLAVGVVVLIVLVAKVTAGRDSVPVSTALENTPSATSAPSAGSPSGAILGPALPSPAAGPASAGGQQFSSAAEQLDWVVANKMPAMVLFHSTNCIPCKAMDKLMQAVRGEYEPDVVFVDVIIGEQANAALVQQAGIRAIPTMFFFSSSGTSDKVVGAMKEDALRAVLDDLKAGK